MSWWVYLERDGKPVEVECHEEGGTFVVGGTTRAELNVTWNYNKPYTEVGFNLRDLDGKAARDMISEMERVVAELGTERGPDYWKATNGNAGFALSILLQWARDNPDAVFRIN